MWQRAVAQPGCNALALPFFDEAVVDMDGSIAPTYGECKQGMGMSDKGEWGYHPLIVSPANTNEVLFAMNRSGNRPSYEGAYI